MPIEKRIYYHFKDKKSPHTLDLYSKAEADQFVDGAALGVPKGYMFFDFDDQTEFSKFLGVLDELNLRQTRIVESDRGGHV